MKTHKTFGAAFVASLLLHRTRTPQSAPVKADPFSLEKESTVALGDRPDLILTAGTTCFLFFDFSSFAANINVKKTALRLYATAVSASRPFDVEEVASKLAENGLDYKNMPAN